MCKYTVTKLPFIIRYVPDWYKSQEMCDKAFVDFLSALKIVPDCFLTSKMIKKLYNALFH